MARRNYSQFLEAMRDLQISFWRDLQKEIGDNDLETDIDDNDLETDIRDNDLTTDLSDMDWDASPESSAASKRLQCLMCSADFETRKQLREHYYCHVKDQIKSKYGANLLSCPLCQKMLLSTKHIHRHIALVHDEMLTFLPLEVQNQLEKEEEED